MKKKETNMLRDLFNRFQKAQGLTSGSGRLSRPLPGP